MNKEKSEIYLSTLFTAVVITMFISSFVTFMSIDKLSSFWRIWPLNWFYAIIIAFPAILIFRPICIKLSKKVISFFMN